MVANPFVTADVAKLARSDSPKADDNNSLPLPLKTILLAVSTLLVILLVTENQPGKARLVGATALGPLTVKLVAPNSDPVANMINKK